MPVHFRPVEEIEVFCRFCKKILPAQLERSIAGNGKTVDRDSTFEYYCTKCFKTFCFSGRDLPERIEDTEQETEVDTDTRSYSPEETYLLGDTIFHKKMKDNGTIIDKDRGNPSRILVKFEKAGIKKLVEGI